MNEKTVLELAVEIAFVQAEEDLRKQTLKSFDDMADHLAQLKREVELIYTAEAKNELP